ncbi:carbohydrate porin [Mucilaginibacter gotjawali]|uniref:High affinity Mn2+ porin n=1 Tax=Mucilaginibacter gotjawali TaxID=1550579 RepID=A0A839SNS1_9SPHI|nr:carbohydrate porin [Mucilaginibacter gotjawali]MBB3058978.1 high affinity Mn2+ porin [Mucilaginibacter gotjawali]
MKKQLYPFIFLITIIQTAFAQDTVKQEDFSFHFQQTIITQDKPGFHAAYSGQNSLSALNETQTSLTATFFGNARLWKGAQVIFDPELSGGAGLSKTLGVAGFPNGETFRVGSVQNKIYIARLFFQQYFEWGKEKDTLESDQLQLAGLRSKRYFSFGIGKFNMGDFFDQNNFSHDPRSQFMNWALMDNAAWDYPANTRGYVLGAYTEFGQPAWTLRFAFTMNVTQANSSTWDAKIGKANTQTVEFEKRYTIGGEKGTLRILGFLNNGKFGNYEQAIALNSAAPNVDTTQAYGRHKVGFGVNADQYLTKDFGVFAKASYNDGHTQTWFFTEIDRSFTFGGLLKGTGWKRKDDEMGLAFVANGLSAPHRQYLADGGYGFLIGDGKLNYAPEMIAEFYYKLNAYQNKFFLSPDYQFIINPAYNHDRGPVNVFSIRAHIEF